MEKILNDLDELYHTMIHQNNFDLAIKIKQLQVKILLSSAQNDVNNGDLDKMSTDHLEVFIKTYDKHSP